MYTTTYTPKDEEGKEYEVDFEVSGQDHDVWGKAYPETNILAVREILGETVSEDRTLDLDGSDKEWWDKNKDAIWDETARVVEEDFSYVDEG